jgi:hypothetical protein
VNYGSRDASADQDGADGRTVTPVHRPVAAGTPVPDLVDPPVRPQADSRNLRAGTRTEETAMKQIQIRKRPVRDREQPLDLRTPSGKPLPY